MPHGAIANHLFLLQELASGILLRQRQQPGEVVTGSRRVVLASVAVVALSLLARQGLRSRDSSGNRARLVAAVGALRPSEGRFTGGFLHSPYSGAVHIQISDELFRNKKEIERKAARGSADALADLAILFLLDGRPQEAVLRLEEAVRINPLDAKLWSDLSASYYARGRMQDRPWDAVLGLNAAEEAFALDPEMPEARFNRAVGLEKIHLASRAREGWVAALQVEPDSSWKKEIETRISGVTRESEINLWDRWRPRLRSAALRQDRAPVEAITERFREAARMWVEGDLLAGWAEAQAGGRYMEAARELAAARIVGEVLAGRGGDPMARDAVAVIDRADDNEEKRHLVEGHRAYGRALRLYPADMKGSLAGMRTASIHLAQAGSPFGAWADFWTAVCAYQLSSYPEAKATLGKLHASPAVSTYAALRGRVEWMLGLIAFQQADFFAAVRAFSQAVVDFNVLDEPENLGSVQSRLSLSLTALGDLDGAWRLQDRALRALRRFRDPWRIGGLYEVSAFQLLRSGQRWVALSFQDEFVRLAIEQADSVTASAALLERSQTLLALDHLDAAQEDLRQAREWMERIPDPAVRETIRGDLAFREGTVLTRTEPARAVEFLNEALRSYLQSDYRTLVVQLYLQRAVARLRTGQAKRAEEDLKAGLAELERVRAAIGSQSLRTSYFELARPAFEEMVRYQVNRGRCGPAFDIWERSRARTLAEAGREGSAALATQDSVQNALLPGTGLVEYAALENGLVVWLVRREGVDCKLTSISARDLAALVRQHRDALIAGSGTSGELAARLHEAVLGPLATGLEGLRALVVIPDRELHQLPFAALQEGGSGRFLVESLSVIMAPSATLWLRSQPRNESSGPPVSVVALGDPAFERRSFPGLPRLDGSKREVRDVAALYLGGEAWVGEDATPSRLLGALRAVEIVHVAAHALPGSPEAPPAILLASEVGDDSDGALSLDELEHLPEVRARIVVLSACGTGVGSLSAMEGPISLARPFVTAGVPSVVVSLWPVRDSASRAFFVTFHSGLRSGLTAPEALRQAQLQALASSESSASSPREWATFVVVGGGS